MFFSFDGLDGGGKTTQIELLCDWLRASGRDVVTCRDPGSTPLGERLRGLLLHSGDDTPIGLTAEMLIYMAARAQLVEEVVRPALLAGKTVVSDRFLLANVVYQGHAGGFDLEAIRSVGLVATARVAPDCVFVLDLDPTSAQARLGAVRDRLESRGAAYQQRLREGFLAEAALDPARLHVIDASRPIEEVHQRIREIAERTLLLNDRATNQRHSS